MQLRIPGSERGAGLVEPLQNGFRAEPGIAVGTPGRLNAMVGSVAGRSHREEEAGVLGLRIAAVVAAIQNAKNVPVAVAVERAKVVAAVVAIVAALVATIGAAKEALALADGEAALKAGEVG